MRRERLPCFWRLSLDTEDGAGQRMFKRPAQFVGERVRVWRVRRGRGQPIVSWRELLFEIPKKRPHWPHCPNPFQFVARLRGPANQWMVTVLCESCGRLCWADERVVEEACANPERYAYECHFCRENRRLRSRQG